MSALTHTIIWRLWPMSKRERNARTSMKLRSSWRHNNFFLLFFIFWFGCVLTINDSLAWCYFIVWTCLHFDVSHIGRFRFEKIKFNSKRPYIKKQCWNCHRCFCFVCYAVFVCLLLLAIRSVNFNTILFQLKALRFGSHIPTHKIT